MVTYRPIGSGATLLSFVGLYLHMPLNSILRVFVQKTRVCLELLPFASAINTSIKIPCAGPYLYSIFTRITDY